MLSEGGQAIFVSKNELCIHKENERDSMRENMEREINRERRVNREGETERERKGDRDRERQKERMRENEREREKDLQIDSGSCGTKESRECNWCVGCATGKISQDLAFESFTWYIRQQIDF